MADQTAVPTYAELMDRSNRAEEKIVRLISEAERTEERLAEELDRARARVTELEAERDQHAETARQATNHAINSTATIAAVRHALAGHPRCEEHPEGDAIKCGWKRAVASVQAAVDAAPAQREPTSHVYVVQWKRYPGGNNEGLDDIVELYADWGEAMDKVRALRDRGYSPGFARNGVHEPRPVTE